ncbi:hypothetical protein ACN2AV_01255 [Lentilactobacillus buchneri subsp. silagei]|uniref:hypothetical protein n=1 Tax=Lentilactobacillus buchneri TaxID=1581 RepID=UPI003AFA8ED3
MSFQFNFSALNDPNNRLTNDQLMKLRNQFLIDSNRKSDLKDEWIPIPAGSSETVSTSKLINKRNIKHEKIKLNLHDQIEYDSSALVSSSYQNSFKTADLEVMLA